MKKVIKGTLFNTFDKNLNVFDAMRGFPKKNNFVERTIEKAIELKYTVVK